MKCQKAKAKCKRHVDRILTAGRGNAIVKTDMIHIFKKYFDRFFDATGGLVGF